MTLTIVQRNQKRLSEHPPRAERVLPQHVRQALIKVTLPAYVSLLEHSRNVFGDYVPYAKRAEDDHHYHSQTRLMLVCLLQESDPNGENVYHAWWANPFEEIIVSNYIAELYC